MNVLIGLVTWAMYLQCLVRSTQANMVPPPTECICTAIFQPVCGDNGITYSNRCVLGCVSKDNVSKGLPPIKIAHLGECKPHDCICAAVVKPICGTDGRTYSNECELGCYNRHRKELHLPPINIAYQGQCKTGPHCNNVIIPVCGSDGRTYRNICYLQYESEQNRLKGLPPIYFRSSGPCKQDSCICPLNLDPICASDGKTYSNNCMLACENRRRRELNQPQLVIVHKGQCKVECICTYEYKPVCGSDGKTYGNICAFNCENKKRIQQGLPVLKIANQGECKGCFCPLYVDPVCGSDGKTYSNACFLACENERRKCQHLPPITVIKKGNCPNSSCVCTTEYKPVCASDYKTYSNPCLLKCENDRLKALGLPLLKILYYGSCNNNCGCPKLYDPVCATDYHLMWTYGNTCELDCVNWRRYLLGLKPLVILHKGPCYAPCSCHCSNHFEPVCGSDKRTYRNLCWLQCTSRCNEAWGYPRVNLVKHGYC